MTRRGAGSQDLSCMGPGVSSRPGFAITALQHTFTPISLPLNVPVKKFKKLDRGDKVIRVIRISGQCERPNVKVGGPGITKMAADPKTQEWWEITMPQQRQLESVGEGEWWAEAEEVFHVD